MKPEEIKAKLESLDNIEAAYKGPVFDECFGDCFEFDVINKKHPKKPVIVIINENNLHLAMKSIKEFYDD